jgi:hypothetical protein
MHIALNDNLPGKRRQSTRSFQSDRTWSMIVKFQQDLLAFQLIASGLVSHPY